MSNTNHQPALPTQKDSNLAQAGLKLLNTQTETSITLQLEGVEKTLPLPQSVVELLQRIFKEMAAGKAVDVIALDTELTTQQAADILNVSRPFIIKLLDQGELPHRLVGKHRRVQLEHVLAYKERMQRRGKAALSEIAELSQDVDAY